MIFCVAVNLNVALMKPAYQSSRHSSSSRNLAASSAVDGSLSTFSATAYHYTGTWWRVDLLNSYNIEGVRIHDERPCCESYTFKSE